MNITNIKIYRNENRESRAKAFVSFTIDDSFAVTGVSIVEGKFGLFLSMPSRKDEKSENGYRDICYPVSKEARKELEEKILKEYEEKKEDFQSAPESGNDSIPF